MSNYSHRVNAKEGEQFNTYLTEQWPVGTLMELSDGRLFRFFENGGTALATGKLCQMPVPGANFDELALPSALTVGQKTISITNGATTVTKDQFKGGFLRIEDDAGEGHNYKITGNDAEAAGSAAFNVYIAAPGILVACSTATTVGLLMNPYRDVIIHPSPATAKLVGVTCCAVGANRFGWLQTKGVAVCLAEGTWVINERLIDSATADGAMAPTASTAAGEEFYVAVALEVVATTEHGHVDLRID